MRSVDVSGTVRGALLIIVRCDSVGVSACDDGGGLWMASVIGLVRGGGTGRGRFTNRPYGVYDLAERRERAWIGYDVVICACGLIGHRVVNGPRTRGIGRSIS